MLTERYRELNIENNALKEQIETYKRLVKAYEEKCLIQEQIINDKSEIINALLEQNKKTTDELKYIKGQYLDSLIEEIK